MNEAGEIVVVVPLGGSQRLALSFANEHAAWLIEKQRAVQAQSERRLRPGDAFLFRGDQANLVLGKDWGRPFVEFGGERVFIADETSDLRPVVRARLKRLARENLVKRTFELAKIHGLDLKRVCIRDQKTRWGSCSSHRSISLNWRLIMAPPQTSDYIILHELMHLKEMNHSDRFWAEVRRVCPDFARQEQWLRKRQSELAEI